MSIKYRDILFWWICFLGAFVGINYHLFPWGNFFGIVLNWQLMAYPLLIGAGYSLYCYFQGKEIFYYNQKIVNYFIVAIIVEFIVILHGICVFPYWESVASMNFPANSRMGQMFFWMKECGWITDFAVAKSVFVVCASLKDALLQLIVGFGGTYMIYCWYCTDYRKAIQIMEKAVIASIFVLFVYCMIELFALCGNDFFRQLYLKLDLILHLSSTETMEELTNWLSNWTVRTKQMKGLWREPSHFGMYANVMVSFLWYMILQKKDKLAIACNLILGFFVVLTSSRAAIGIQIAMLMVLMVALLYKRDKVFLKRGAIIIFSSIVVLFAGNYFIKHMFLQNNFTQAAPYVKGEVSEYLQSNVGSLAQQKARSNNSRYTYAYVAWKTGLESPLLGVGGSMFRSAYVEKHIPEWGRNDSEVKKFLNIHREKGFLAAGFPVLNQYCEIFAEKGIIGLIVFLFPFGYILWRLICFYKCDVGNELPVCILLFELLCGIALWGLNARCSSYYTTWVVLAICLIFINVKAKNTYVKEKKVINS